MNIKVLNVLLREDTKVSNSKYNTGRMNQMSRGSVKIIGIHLALYDVSIWFQSASAAIKHTPLHKHRGEINELTFILFCFEEN